MLCQTLKLAVTNGEYAVCIRHCVRLTSELKRADIVQKIVKKLTHTHVSLLLQRVSPDKL
jgi:roadblock/LC7 domain-containing protein